MTSVSALEEDLASWEAGELSRAELEARWPDTDLGGLLDLHRRLAAAADRPVGQPSWDELEERLDRLSEVGVSRQKPVARQRFRRVAALAAASLFMGGVAFGAQPGTLSEQLGGLWQEARSFLGADDLRPRPTTDPAGGPNVGGENPQGLGRAHADQDDVEAGKGSQISRGGGDEDGREIEGGDGGDQSTEPDDQGSETDEDATESDDPTTEGDEEQSDEGADPTPEGGDDPESDPELTPGP